MNQTLLIIRREFIERVSKKSFIIVTLTMPLLMLLFSILPALVMALSGPENRTFAVIDRSGVIMPALHSDEEMKFIHTDQSVDQAKNDDKYGGVIFIPADVVKNPVGIQIYTDGPLGMNSEQAISAMIASGIEHQRLKQYNLPDVDQILRDIEVDPKITSYRLDKDEDQQASTGVSFALGMVLSLILYMFMLLYGQMVMTSIIEEKNNRVLELVVTSVKPIRLMMGKILGIGSVAVVQILIWIALMSAITAFVLPATLPSDLMTEVSAANAGKLDAANASYDLDLINVIQTFGSVGYILKLMFTMLLFLLGGYLFYSALFAAVGSAVDNIQDASQLTTAITMPIIIGLIMAITVAGNPTSVLGIVCSYIPFTSPMVMMARLPYGVEWWEVLISAIVLFGSFVVTAWLAAKIYRVGIFMHGKKPSLRQLWYWTRES